MNQWDILQRAKSLTEAKAWDRAQVTWEQLTELNPFNGAYWKALGTAHYHQGLYRDAIVAYEHALELGADRLFFDRVSNRVLLCAFERTRRILKLVGKIV